MLFNSFEFIFAFLPIVVIGYFLLNRLSPTVAKIWLILSSFFFYAWWNPVYLPLLIASIIVNYIIGVCINKATKLPIRKSFLTLGIIFNVGLLGFFKYFDFFVTNLNFVLQTDFNLLNLFLPLAISFYTFQQIAYLVDTYRKEAIETTFLNYVLFISFFPQLIAGPIVTQKDIMGQYVNITKKRMNFENISKGLFIFSIGLFKKVGIADTFSVWVSNGYNQATTLTFFDSWVTSLSYTFQLYFDFSGYSDMAIGIALLFNIRLPINFNSPYKATTVREFWQRWHMTLSRFLGKYIYVPLGGNRGSRSRTYINLLLVLTISGFWHGAGWTYIAWGFMHGVAMVINRIWYKAGFRMNMILAWFITFHFVNITRVFFRSPDFSTALSVLASMFGLNGFEIPEQLAVQFNLGQISDQIYTYALTEDLWQTLIYLLSAFIITSFMKNSIEMTRALKPNPLYAMYASALFIYSALHLDKITEFIYFNF